MELHKLKYFYTVAKYQHITRAAEQLHISQPSLSQAIHSLEQELGVPLLAKRGRGVYLTEFGEHLMGRLDQLLPELDALPDEMEQLKNKVSKTIKLNILAASTFVINSIVSYREKHPDVIFDFEQNRRKYDCDIVISTNGLSEEGPGNYVQRCVKQEMILLAVPRDSVYAKRRSIELSEVRDESFVLLSSSRLFGVICNKFCAMSGFEPKTLFESDSPMAVQNIISTGTGIAFWPEYSWGKVKNKNGVLLPISSPVCRRDLIFELNNRAHHSEYAEDFYNFLLDQI